jgi:hypothetical protein
MHVFSMHQQVWHSFAPFKVKFHVWLDLRQRCWTADRLIRRGMHANPLCSLCRVSTESLDHQSLQCPFAGHVWFGVARRLGFSIPVPLAMSMIPEWWPLVVDGLSRHDSKKSNSPIMLTMHSLWLERNARVFYRMASPITRVIDSICSEREILDLGSTWFARGVD